MIYRIDVWPKSALWRRCDSVPDVMYMPVKLFFLDGVLGRDDVERICRDILVDPVAEDYAINQPPAADHTIDVTRRPGVTDPAAESLSRAVGVLNIKGLARAATGTRFLLSGSVDRAGLEMLAEREFSNPLIQRHQIDGVIDAPFVPVQATDDTVETVRLSDANDEKLRAISQERRLSLDLREMQAIRAYFQSVERDPTDAELEMLAQTWSEHCVHKTFRARIEYTGPTADDPTPREHTIDGLLKTYIRAATEQVAKDWVYSAFVDNAGIVRFDDAWDLAFKAETHNRPSALEPFGGANTGVGGVIRDVLGVSARPIANTDILFFGPPDLAEHDLPEGVLHPRRIASGVVAGIEDYGNKMGIPTVNGAIFYDRGYVSNPLVFCGCVGILPHGSHRTGAQPGDLIVVIGGRTGRDGLRGATFSSMEMDVTTSELSGGAVQIGHPIHEKQVQEVVLRVRDAGLYNAITDCGAGGLSSAVGEMGEHLGAVVQLDAVPLKYPGLRPWEIWLSEAQERMVLAVPPGNWEQFQAICAGQDVEVVVIGTFEPTGRLTLHYGDTFVGDLTMEFLHGGLPQKHLKAEWMPLQPALDPVPTVDMNQALLDLLSLPNIRSKEAVIRRYDHEVQGGTALKPLVGMDDHGPGDATVIVPQVAQTAQDPVRGIALSVGLCPQYTRYDPYAMAWAAVDEALRNMVAVGADPDQVSILDNFSWGNTNLPDRLGELVRAAQGCHDAAIAYDVPFISGKDSLNNEYLGEDGQRHAIPGTLVISAMGIVPDVGQTVSMDLKAAGNKLYLIGETQNDLRGSHFADLLGIDAGNVPQPDPDALARLRVLHQAITAGMVQACHDLSEGGVAVALAEMCIAGRLGASIALDGSQDAIIACFAETTGRFVVEVAPEDTAQFEQILADVPHWQIGTVNTTGVLAINDWIDLPIHQLETAWRGERQPAEAPADDLPAQTASQVERMPTVHTEPPRVLILHANGTNRDHDAALACELAGGSPEIVHINQLLAGERMLLDYHMLVVPGGFSYGDDLGAGMLWGLDLRARLQDSLEAFIADGRPVLGICNGFQTLVKAGVLPGEPVGRQVTLTYNAHDQFECRWVYLQPNPASPSLFLHEVETPFYVPVAHGEGRVLAADDATAERLWHQGLVGLRYVTADGKPAGYPANPNGSLLNIAGLSNPAGNVFGLMPHPENHVFAWQHPRWHRGEQGMDGLRLFQNGIRFA